MPTPPDPAPRRAVILSAGQGSRLLPLTEDLPKCLLDVAGRSVLAWQLAALAQSGVAEAVVVTGFRSDRVEAALPAITPRGLQVRHLFNPFYKVADNLASCWMARAEFAPGCLLLNGDMLFEPAVARRLLAAPPAPVTLAIDRKAGYDDDDMKVEVEADTVRAVGKTLPRASVNGESIGFLRFAADGAALFVAEIERTLRTANGTGLWYLSAISRIAAARPGCVRAASVEGLAWAELDYPADLHAAQAMAARWPQEP